MPLTLPNLLTWLRIAAIPLFVGVFYLSPIAVTQSEKNAIATSIFVAAAITDWLDGWLARTMNQTSAFGAFLDPVADKLMVAAALVLLVQLGRADAVVALVIIGREIAISALREWMAKVGAARSVAVSYVGKIKTTAQMIAVPLLLFDGFLAGISMRATGTLLLWVAAVLTLWSMIYYLRKALPYAFREPPSA